MPITLDILFTVVGMVGAAALALWGFARWVLSQDQRIVMTNDEAHAAIYAKLSSDVRDLHKRIDETRREMLSKGDLEGLTRHVDKLQTSVERVDSRLDQIMQLLMERAR